MEISSARSRHSGQEERCWSVRRASSEGCLPARNRFRVSRSGWSVMARLVRESPPSAGSQSSSLRQAGDQRAEAVGIHIPSGEDDADPPAGRVRQLAVQKGGEGAVPPGSTTSFMREARKAMAALSSRSLTVRMPWVRARTMAKVRSAGRVVWRASAPASVSYRPPPPARRPRPLRCPGAWIRPSIVPQSTRYANKWNGSKFEEGGKPRIVLAIARPPGLELFGKMLLSRINVLGHARRIQGQGSDFAISRIDLSD